jgi:hypothetical protein
LHIPGRRSRTSWISSGISTGKPSTITPVYV